jgi:hypothetical protein
MDQARHSVSGIRSIDHAPHPPPDAIEAWLKEHRSRDH